MTSAELLTLRDVTNDALTHAHQIEDQEAAQRAEAALKIIERLELILTQMED